jgi:hypothetical protein
MQEFLGQMESEEEEKCNGKCEYMELFKSLINKQS